MKKTYTILFLSLLFVGFAGTSFCSGKKAKANEAKTQEQATEITANSKDVTVVLQTNMGDITLTLYPKIAPKTVANFVGLAEGSKEFIDPATRAKTKRPYFDGLIFHRIIPGFMIQGGDILGNGSGGPGYRFEDEISAKALGLDKTAVSASQYYTQDAQQYVFRKLNIQSQEELDKRMKEVQNELAKVMRGGTSVEEVLTGTGYVYQNDLQSMPVKKYTIAMANAGPNTNGSQFFINLADNEFLNGKHTVFGKVTDGFDVVEKIGAVKTGMGDKPVKDVIIEKVIVKR